MFRVKKTFRSPCMSSYMPPAKAVAIPEQPVMTVMPVIERAPALKILSKKKPKYLPGEKLLKEAVLNQQRKSQVVKTEDPCDLDMFKNSITEMVKRMRV